MIKYAQAMTKRESRHNITKWRLSKRQTRASANIVDAQITPPRSPGSPQSGPSSQARRRRKIAKKDRTKCYRELEKLRNELSQSKKRAEKYTKRSQRAEAKLTTPNDQTSTQKETPRSKTRRLLRNCHVDAKVRKRIQYHYNLVNNLRMAYRCAEGQKAKRAIFDACTRKIKKKYITLARNEIGFSEKMWYRYPKDKSTKKPIKAAEMLKTMVQR